MPKQARCTICRALTTNGTTCDDAKCIERAQLYRERAEAWAQWKGSPKKVTPNKKVKRSRKPRRPPIWIFDE
jgi:hypothetical protein